TAEAGIGADILDDDGLSRDEHPARDSGAGRNPPADERVGALAGDRREDELVRRLVEDEDRGGPSPEDGARHLDDRLEERCVVVLRPGDAGGQALAEVVAPAHEATFEAVRKSTFLSAKAVSSGCLLRTRAQIPAICGVAKLFPVTRSRPPPSQATSTSTPRAKNSTGGAGL